LHLSLLYITGRSGLENKLWFSINGPGGFLLALGGPGCKSAGPCHLWYVVLNLFFILFIPLGLSRLAEHYNVKVLGAPGWSFCQSWDCYFVFYEW